MGIPISAPATFASQMMRRESVARLQGEIDRAAQEVSTGRHADAYGALGTQAGRAIGLHAELARVDTFLSSNKMIEGRLAAMEDALGAMSETAQSVLTLAVPNRDEPAFSAAELQVAARDALTRIADISNTTHAGRRLFSGVDSDGPGLVSWGSAGSGGTSPEAAMQAIVAGGPASAADAAAKSAAVEALFSGGYEGVFYEGAPATGPRLSAAIDTGAVLEYGIQADDPGFRDVVRGLSMLASTDVSQIEDPEAYAAWMGDALDALSRGIDGLIQGEARTGEARGHLEATTLRLQDRRDLLHGESNALEGVDPYEAATRMSDLETRLQASYAVTARLAQMSFLNFL
ncbi:flagellin [Roseivivax isoporae]|uniref:Flagellin n=1 Tax=Roseivivax isoporae LMG 25204 TaxID=1449351 RepID=X7F833_9RHOB|nr:flagellin [Roseivivax isoporae]ETX28893.1 hypothetical protein RISW2_04060 [Roseivivax isoporae LMG 25204]